VIQEKVKQEFSILRSEIAEELRFVGKSDFSATEALFAEKFNQAVYDDTKTFLETLKKFYSIRYNKADQEKDNRISRMTNSAEKEKSFEEFKNSYHNEAIAEVVKNITETHRIIEKDGKLIQKIYPIYKDPDPSHMVDFDAQFYMPAKHFLNRNIDTLYFNLGVIWAMTLLLTFTLYFELLRKLIDGLGNLTNPLPKRM
jgi:hypothetical protein